MGLINRIRRITVSRVESFLSSAEDPELLLPQLIKEMEDQVRSATEAEAKARASVKTAEQELSDISAKVKRFEKGAELALSNGDEDTAREALSAQMSMESEMNAKTSQAERLKTAMNEAKSARKHIQAELDDLRAKKDEILTRARVSKTKKKINKTVQGPTASTKSILDSVASLETKVDETEAALEVQNEICAQSGVASLDKRLEEMENKASIEARMAAMRDRIKK